MQQIMASVEELYRELDDDGASSLASVETVDSYLMEIGRKRKGMNNDTRGIFEASAEGEIKVCTRLCEISFCSCLTVLLGPAWVLLSKICILLFWAM